MPHSVFVEIRFWLLVLCSLIVPSAIYVTLYLRRAVSPLTVLVLGLVLLLVAGLDVYLLQSIGNTAMQTPSLADDKLFVSELSMALYLLPLTFGGIGVNLISHVLLR
ncbi:MAG TPA: hypothetical protein PLP08_18395, partial [Plasticicumulans sp.]